MASRSHLRGCAFLRTAVCNACVTVELKGTRSFSRKLNEFSRRSMKDSRFLKGNQRGFYILLPDGACRPALQESGKKYGLISLHGSSVSPDCPLRDRSVCLAFTSAARKYYKRSFVCVLCWHGKRSTICIVTIKDMLA